MNFNIRPKLVLSTLLATIGLMLVANIVVLASKARFSTPGFKIFHFGEEQNIPTLYSSLTLFVAGALLAIMALAYRRAAQPVLHWALLALIFVFLSLDEFAMVHERSIIPLRQLFDTSGAFYFAWIIPYGIGLVGLAIVYAKFLWNLPPKTMKLFVVSGVIFVSGAIGIEMVEGVVHDTYGFGFIFQMCQTAEETLEMVGVAIFIYALLDHMVDKFESVAISVK